VFSFCGCSKPRLLSLRPKSSAQHPVPRSPSDRPKCWSAARLRGVFPPRDCAVRNTRIVFLFQLQFHPMSIVCSLHIFFCTFSVCFQSLCMWPVSIKIGMNIIHFGGFLGDAYRDPCLRPFQKGSRSRLGRNYIMQRIQTCIRHCNPSIHPSIHPSTRLNVETSYCIYV